MIHHLQHYARMAGVYDYAATVYLKFLALRNQTELAIETPRGRRVISLRRGSKVLRAAPKHLVYCADLIRFFDYYFDAVEPQMTAKDQIVDYSTPREHRLRGNDIPFYFSSFAEPAETTDLYIQKGGLREGNVVLDVGAYCGAATYAFSQAVGPTGKVFAFEPDNENYEALLRNIGQHQMSNVTAIRQGIWSSEELMAFHSEGNMGSSLQGFLNRGGQTCQISVTTIPAVMEKNQITRLDFIKMDIEGAEIEALRGAKEVLKQFKPRLMIEPHKLKGVLTTQAVCELLSECGYNCEVLPQADLDLPLIYAAPLT